MVQLRVPKLRPKPRGRGCTLQVPHLVVTFLLLFPFHSPYLRNDQEHMCTHSGVYLREGMNRSCSITCAGDRTLQPLPEKGETKQREVYKLEGGRGKNVRKRQQSTKWG